MLYLVTTDNLSRKVEASTALQAVLQVLDSLRKRYADTDFTVEEISNEATG